MTTTTALDAESVLAALELNSDAGLKDVRTQPQSEDMAFEIGRVETPVRASKFVFAASATGELGDAQGRPIVLRWSRVPPSLEVPPRF